MNKKILLLCLILTVSLQASKSDKNPVDEFLYETIMKHAGPAGKKVLTNYPLAREIVSYLDLENDMYKTVDGKGILNYQNTKNTISQTILCQKLLRKNKPDYTLQRTEIPALNGYPLPYIHPQKPDTSIKLLSQKHKDRFIWFNSVIEHNDTKTAEIMLRCGADTSITNWNGHSILLEACFKQNEEIAKIAINHGIDVNQQSNHMCFSRQQDPTGITPLHAAIMLAKSLPIARMLLEKGADINAQNYLGKTTLMTILERYHTNFISLLLEYKADLSRKDNNGETCLYKTINYSPDILKDLLHVGAQQDVINLQNNKGETLLHRAVQCKKDDTIKLLLQHGADKTIQDNDGKTPLDYTDTLFDKKDKKIIRKLLKTHTK